MRSVAIVVIRELRQHPAQVALVDHDYVVEALGPNRPHDPFGYSVAFGARGGVRNPAIPRLASLRSKSPP